MMPVPTFYFIRSGTLSCRDAGPCGTATSPMRRRIICCRCTSRLLGLPGLSSRGLMIAPARSAA